MYAFCQALLLEVDNFIPNATQHQFALVDVTCESGYQFSSSTTSSLSFDVCQHLGAGSISS